MDQHWRCILAEIGELLASARADEAEHAYRLIARAPRVFAFATGRSGFVLRAFVMRLNHLGQAAYFVGEASCPPVGRGDLFVVASGSGSTSTTLGAAMEAGRHGAEILAIVGSRVSPLGQLASAVVELPAPHKRGVASEGGARASRQTAGSLFEQACFVFLEAVILRRFSEQGGDRAAPLARHANVEA
ncbi:MAG: 6-phospho-3-hexuloisomerase [Planctomycetota bacterium]|nr:SIS domain-containing protein [Planctomycetota bacterium]MDW8373666.1 6-phospho-3-hexuloisomerase [Planctomycetota bacterium]